MFIGMKARFHLPDFVAKYRFNLVFAEFLKNCPQYFRDGVEIASVYGAFPQSTWNGGRTQDGFCQKPFIKSVIKAYNDRGIPLRFTFTNPMIEEKHLHDEFCNMVLQLADNGFNEVIVFSPLLEEYIRKNYPNYPITSSTCKRITDADTLIQEVQKDYHIVVIDYDFNHNYEVLEKIPDKKKCELLVNACCQPNCPSRAQHYRSVGIQQIAYAEHVRKYGGSKAFDNEKLKEEHPEITRFNACPWPNKKLFEVTGLKNHVTPDEIWGKLIPMGFEQFKIEGRTFDMFNLIEHYMYYMVRPECKDQARMEFLLWLQENEVIEVRA